VIVDYHMHLRNEREEIDHTVAAVERFVARAAERGVDEIGMTEHVYYFRQTRELWDLTYQTERCVYDLDVYVDALVEAKRQGMPVKVALEVDYIGELQPRLTEILAPYPWDYLLGSVHWIGGEAVDARPGMWATHEVEEVWDAYFGALAELAGSGAVDVLAHPDLAKIYGQRPDGDLERFWSRLDGIDVAFEISTAGLRKPVGELYPDAGFLRHAPAVTLASDAHEPRLVGEDFALAVEHARVAGFDTVSVFEGRRRRQEPLG
jgi:histidinol-phosphatase (PHP family)